MQLNWGPQVEAFRGEVVDWLGATLPADWSERRDRMSPAERRAFDVEWDRTVRAAGWMCATWPREYGGRGLSTIENIVLHEEFARAGVMMWSDHGDSLVGPTILQWGTDEQKRHYLPPIQAGSARWCQGFSEPDSGSDLASLRTSAVRDGDRWVINGQKIWTTGAREADFCYLLARTNPHAARHQGISYLLVPMDQPGIEVRPITQPDGTAEFNEVFFDDAETSVDAVVGGVDNGWVVANTTLGHERGVSAATSFLRFRRELELLRAAAPVRARDDPTVRQRLAALHTRVEILRISGLRSLAATIADRRGPDIVAIDACNKTYWSELHRDIMECAVALAGAGGMIADAGPESWPGDQPRTSRPGYAVGPMMSAFLFSRSETIFGGTSEIQRNIIAERVLGLPRDPKPAAARAPAER